MTYIPACQEGGTPDFITPWTDLYIVPTGSIESDGQELEDVSGKPNTVQSLTADGVFASETIGFTGPGGKIGPGKYAIVFDECQDGKFNELVDGLIDPAFEVVYTTGVVPPLDLTKLKEDAEKEAERWSKFKEYMEKLFKLEKAVDAANPNEKFVDFLMRSGLVDPREGALIQLGNQAKHYEGIAADPPNPDYQHVTPIGSRPVFDFQSNDPLDLAVQAVDDDAANEQAITRQLWTLLEQYQGAQAAGDVSWALSHARELNRNLDLLLSQLQKTSQDVSRLNQVLAADSRPFTQTAAELEQLRSRIVASGFTNDEIRHLLSLGLSDAQISQIRTDLAQTDYSFVKNDVLAWQSGMIDVNNIFGPDLIAFGSNLEGIINTLLSDPTVIDHDPVVQAGGPYSGNEGSPISFTAAGSSSPSGITSYAWDLDGDGVFGDAQGPDVSYTYNRAFRGLAGLKVTDGDGNEGVDYAQISVEAVNHRPVLSSITPSVRYAGLNAGSSRTFAVAAADPDNNPVSTEWFVDGVSAGSAGTFTYSPSLPNAGMHNLEAVVTDGKPGGSVRTGWTVQVLKPIPSSIELTPGSKTLRVGTAHTLQAKVTDNQGHAVAGLPVSLVITGANAGTLTAVTDDGGIAAFTYTGSQAGDDQAKAQAALLESNTAAAHWIPGDVTAPVTTASLTPAAPDGPGGVYASPVTVTLAATDDDTGVSKTEYRINGGTWQIYSAPFNIGVNGTYTVDYRSTDNAGNVENYRTASFTVELPVEIPDTTPPVTTIAFDPAAPNGQNGYYVQPVAVSFSAVDDKSGVAATEYRLDGGAWIQFGNMTVIVSEGNHTLDYRSTDLAGNEEAVKTASFRIDFVKPAVTASVTPAAPDGTNGWYVSPVSVTLASSDAGSGIAKTEYRVNGGSWSDYTGPFAPGTDGSYALNARATDAAGNVSDISSISVKLDRTKPVTTAALSPPSPDGAGGSYASDVTFTLAATDAASGIAKTEYRVDGGGWLTYGGTAFTISTPGPHKVEYRSTDQAGNADVHEAAFTIDKTKPLQVLFNPESSGRNVALLESGASVISSSSSYDGFHTPQAMLDYSASPYYPWATGANQLNGQYVKFALAGGTAYLIDKVQLMPRIEYAGQRVKDFEIAVSTTTTDDAAFTTVLTATAADNGSLQDFQLPKPVMAKYIRYRPLTRQGNDGCGCISTQQLKVNTGQEGGPTVTFRNLTSAEPGRDIVKWSWDFGDGTTSSELSPTHTYASPGTYTVTLKATDSAGITGSFSLTQTVLGPPAADFTANPGSPNEGQQVTFTDASTFMNGGRVIQRTWNWGDGTPPETRNATTPSITHTYYDNGIYEATLFIIDDKGQTAQVKKTVKVLNVSPSVAAGYKQWVETGKNLTFNPTYTDPGRDNFSCRWDFGDGTSSNQCAFSHTYPMLPNGSPDRTFKATFTVTDDDGGTGTAALDITVYTPSINQGNAIKDGDLYYSRYCTTPNLRKLTFNYDGANALTLTPPETVATTSYADGLIFAPDGDLLVGAGSTVHKVNPKTGAIVTRSSNGAAAYHLALDKSGKKLWAASIPGWLIEFPLDPDFGAGTVHPITGDETAVTSIAFDPSGNAYYTSSGSGGYGSFGSIDLTTFKTTRLLSNTYGVHGMFFDTYTGHLIMDGYNQLIQYDPVARKVVSVWYAPPMGVQFDQGAVDGKGHILVASNDGHMLFMDYSVSKEVGSPHNFVSLPYVESCMDDVAPLSGAGALPPAAIGLTPPTADLTVGQTHTFTALVTDAKGNTMAGTTVTLEITGANPGTLTSVTNSGGVASFSYKGTKAGDDSAVAKASTIASNPAAVHWKLPDTKPPVTSAVYLPNPPNGTNGWEISDFTLTLSAADDESGVKLTEFRTNGGVWTAYSSPIVQGADGVYTFEFRSTDNAGNVEDVRSLVVKLDKTAPVTTKTIRPILSSNGRYIAGLEVTLNQADNLSGVIKTEYRINGGAWMPYTGPFTLTADTARSLEFRSIDEAGNIEATKFMDFITGKCNC